LSQPKTEVLGTPEEQAVRGIVLDILTKHPEWIAKFHADKVSFTTDLEAWERRKRRRRGEEKKK
jgi:hypothetical protein